MNLRLRFFASIREAVGTGQESWESTATTVAELRAELCARGGAYARSLAPGRAVRVAVDQLMVSDDHHALREGAEVAFFPPVTGG